MVGAKPPQRILDRADQPAARGAPVLRAVAYRQAGLGRDQHRVAAPLDRFAQNLFGRAVRIYVGGIEQGDPGVETDVDQPPSLGRIAGAPSAEQRPLTAERPSSKAPTGNPKSRRSELPNFHENRHSGVKGKSVSERS